MFCGTDPLPELFRAKRYKIHQKFLTKTDFQFIMRNLPVEVAENDIDDMFAVADTDNDGKLGYKVQICYKKLFGYANFINDIIRFLKRGSCQCTFW